jgi:membrane-associated phospholipid phosphatase
MPFCIKDPKNLLPPKLELSSVQYAKDLEEVRIYGAKQSTVRTPDQTAAAAFWSLGSNTDSPAGVWNRIANQISAQKKLNALQQTRLLALLNIAQADSAIATWTAKYHYNFWRPNTAIREAFKVPNSPIKPDPNWVPLLPTPNHPSYVSGHSAFSRASATILANQFGEIPFETFGDPNAPKTTRKFESFDQAANEAGMSRIYGGIHFQFDNVEGQKIGRAVANETLNMMLKPL